MQSSNLSKEKLYKRLDYIPQELKKRDYPPNQLVEKCNGFIEDKYNQSPHECLVHGDLKLPHLIESKEGLYYIDLALVSVASPWYDLAFLYMEQKDKKGKLDEISRTSWEVLGIDIRLTEEKIKNYLRSSIFYRCLYNVAFACRHRTDKTLKRTLYELEEILQE